MHCLRLPPIRLIPDANHSAYEENGSRRDKSAPHEQTDSPEGSCRCCLLSRTHFCMFVGGGEGDTLLQEEQGTPSNSGNDTHSRRRRNWSRTVRGVYRTSCKHISQRQWTPRAQHWTISKIDGQRRVLLRRKWDLWPSLQRGIVD